MKTLRVQWAEGAIEQAVQRLTTIVQETSTEATHTVVGRPLSWMDLACLLDFVRQCDGDHAPVYKKLLALVPDEKWAVEPPSLGEVVDAVLVKLVPPGAEPSAPQQDAGKFDEFVAATIRTAVDEWRVQNDPADPHGVSMQEYIRRALADADLLAIPGEVDGLGEQDETLPLALLRGGVRDLLGQVDAMGQLIRKLQAQIDLVPPGQCSSSRWMPGDIVLDQTNFVWQRYEYGWRTVPRDRGVQYEDEQLESLAGPLVRLASVPDEVDELGAVPAAVAQRLREEADRG